MSEMGKTEMSKQQLRIDLVSDVSCPWCIVGYKRLELAMAQVADTIDVDVHWHPFELNLDLHQGGVNLRDYLMKRYGTTADQSVQVRDNLTKLGKEVGFDFHFSDDMNVYNTRDAHKLVAWAAESGKQTEMKLALFQAYFSENKAIEDHDVLAEAAKNAGLDPVEAKQVTASEHWNKVVEDDEVHWLSLGVHAVPALVVNQQHLISGAQPVDVLVEAMKDIASEVQV
ncbi:putative dithiol-disulfide isomerase involved in polyketide biosynthesis FrnE family [Vibrio nigripulchritudo SFn27]|nr:DsbA family oxidoreductase [Vibrio nigripulchritudo]CCN83120.1 putative dithiol-disulfide isomerase involved in polyketide biosynthesis FrnE family [Vibrio nigripulchritudo BLFn1]CCN86276.1 putative dithiol-disulfide isomerase involved in polyketide biosynthesis FrnE family [Vibrio nigripulchritudo SFn27]CCN92836.1 putative dithiol-disulfide isomerase involved in polyketide biosynthesis FrnE family [Vibrio nigripulchritudo ENn2]CCO42729.1 putative dithiol-disulfide isomerase involved in poly